MSEFENDPNGAEGSNVAGTRMVPHITIQAFCENAKTAQMIENAVADRRMNKVALTTHNGGINAAIEIYKVNPTPNLIVLESTLGDDELLNALNDLAGVCDASTKVIVIGHTNDVELYRKLMRFGVSEYLVMPIASSALVDAISEQFASDASEPIGRTIAFYGVKGGAGSSTIAHNTAWAISQSLRRDVLILDMDLAYGTAGLNYNQEPPHGLADAVFSGDVVDDVVIDRLMSKCANHVNLLTAPGTLDRDYDFSERSFEQIVEICQKNVPIVVLDLPHSWNGWVRHTLTTVDEIVLVAEPDLANLRNAKTVLDRLKDLRQGETEPILTINRVGVPKRPEITPSEFAASIDVEDFSQIPFDPAIFGSAANNGQMIAEVNASHKVNEIFAHLSQKTTGRQDHVGASSQGMLPGLLKKLKLA